MAKRRSGLHKEISSIFDGIPHPGSNRSDGNSARGENVGVSSERKIFIPDFPRVNAPMEQTTKPAPPKAAPSRPVQPARPRQTGSGEKDDLLQFLQPIVTKILTPKEGADAKWHIIKIIAVSLLLVVFIVLFVNALNLGGSDLPAGDGLKAAVEQSVTQLAPVKIKWERPKIYSLDEDPMQLGNIKLPGQDEQADYVLHITAIVISDE